MPYKNKEDQAAYARRHYEKNKEVYLERARIYTTKMREEVRSHLQKLKEDTPCTDCGVNYPYYVMQFDHLNDKKFNMANTRKWSSWSVVQNEIDKCEIVCANCHAEWTHQRRVIA